MKFGKRLAAEAARCWPEACLDYKAIKRALKHDLAAADPTARSFLEQLMQELTKVSGFYVEKAEALEALLAKYEETCSMNLEQLSGLRAQIRQLIKFVALNYLAVVKAIKKRNRHCKAVFGAEATGPALHPMDLLSQEVFFTSPRLAALSTQAELLEAAAAAAAAAAVASKDACDLGSCAQQQPVAPRATGDGSAAGAVEIEDYQCPICLDVLRSPVVLNCTHRFCWGCLVAHCASVTGPSSTTAAADDAATAAQQQSSGPCCQQQSCHHRQDLLLPSDEEMTRLSDGEESAGFAPASASSKHSLSKRSTGSTGRGEGLVVLEKLVAADSSGSGNACAEYYNCPVCRQPQVLNIDNLQVDPHLSRFVDELRLRLRTTSTTSLNSVTSSSTVVSQEQQRKQEQEDADSNEVAEQQATDTVNQELSAVPEEANKYLLPRQLPHHAGRLTVLLDLDGTLVSSFTPRRAPRLPASMKTHLVGVGSSLNPAGVFVVERPGLTPFLQQLAAVAEVVVFTAGLEEYASPIIDSIDPGNKFISGRLYRPATMRTTHHQCIKDLAMLGRPLSRTVLVDDTPLAFLHQPANGVPVLGFRGDPDDRLLMEAVLPLLQTLASSPDVRVVLERRFDMMNWFKRHGYPDSVWQQCQAEPDLAVARANVSVATHTTGQAIHAAPSDVQVVVEDAEPGPPLLVFDFDKTLTDWDAGERVVAELAPELVPWLASLEQPANFVPITNEVLKEMARRGVSRDKLLTSLQFLGAELPGATVRMLQWAKKQQLPVKVLSDCNSVFISHILMGARMHGHVGEVITNGATFEKVAASEVEDAGVGLGITSSLRKAPAGATYKLVIQPRHPESAAPHGCPLCPANLCKGAELNKLRHGGRGAAHEQHLCTASSSYGRIVYCGDGANDICPALSLGSNDVVLARAGHALAKYAAAAAGDCSLQQFAARVYTWESHEHLAKLVKEHSSSFSKMDT